jgi:TRAP-type C4-dicarboxylate transport system permease small subunit
MSVIKWIDANAEKALASALLAMIVLLIFVNVFMRYIMNASLSWGEELTLWLFVSFGWASAMRFTPAITYGSRRCAIY